MASVPSGGGRPLAWFPGAVVSPRGSACSRPSARPRPRCSLGSAGRALLGDAGEAVCAGGACGEGGGLGPLRARRVDLAPKGLSGGTGDPGHGLGGRWGVAHQSAGWECQPRVQREPHAVSAASFSLWWEVGPVGSERPVQALPSLTSPTPGTPVTSCVSGDLGGGGAGCGEHVFPNFSGRSDLLVQDNKNGRRNHGQAYSPVFERRMSRLGPG